MLPLLKNGDEILLNPHAKIGVNDIVLAKHPYKKDVTSVKRVKNIEKGDRFFLIGDNPDESTDSRQYGLIEKNQILGKVEFRLFGADSGQSEVDER